MAGSIQKNCPRTLRLIAGLVLIAAHGGLHAASLNDVAAWLNIDRSQITLSGVSSGAYMAQQFHVAHASHVAGVGLLAGGPYRCAAGKYQPWSLFDATGLHAATSVCSDTNPFWFYQGPPDTEFSVRETRRASSAGLVDDTAGLRGDRVWLFSGGADETVPSAVVDTLERYYLEFVDTPDLHREKLDGAAHGMITDSFGNECEVSRSPWLNDCDFDAAGELLRHLHGALRPRAAEGQLQPIIGFDQFEFFDHDDHSVSMNPLGHIYVPASCRNGAQCRLHVAFHGCRQYQELIGEAYYRRAGYNAWAESNAIVVLYPQTRAWPGRSFYGVERNPRGCWDWWGYSGRDWHTRNGKQIRAVAAMIDQLLGEAVLAH